MDASLSEIDAVFLDLDGTILIRFSEKVKGVIRASQIATGEELQQNNLLIQLFACILFPTLLFLDRNKD